MQYEVRIISNVSEELDIRGKYEVKLSFSKLLEYKGLYYEYNYSFFEFVTELTGTEIRRIKKEVLFELKEGKDEESLERNIITFGFSKIMKIFKNDSNVETNKYNVFESPLLLDLIEEGKCEFIYTEDFFTENNTVFSYDFIENYRGEMSFEECIDYFKKIILEIYIRIKNRVKFFNRKKKTYSKLEYIIYNVEGFCSEITDGNGLSVYIDAGDDTNSTKINDDSIFILSHYHCDHYNLVLNNNNIKMILPYPHTVIIKGKQKISSKSLLLSTQNRAMTTFVLSSSSLNVKGGTNKMIKTPINLGYIYNEDLSFINIYTPEFLHKDNRNIESFIFEIKGTDNTVIYPGDNKDYMYNQVPIYGAGDTFVISHHGGNVGKVRTPAIPHVETILNTYKKNSKSINFNTYRNVSFASKFVDMNNPLVNKYTIKIK